MIHHGVIGYEQAHVWCMMTKLTPICLPESCTATRLNRVQPSRRRLFEVNDDTYGLPIAKTAADGTSGDAAYVAVTKLPSPNRTSQGSAVSSRRVWPVDCNSVEEVLPSPLPNRATQDWPFASNFLTALTWSWSWNLEMTKIIYECIQIRHPKYI